MSRSLDRLALLATFVRIAERGSISAAARDLGLSQASASRQLADLENRLGADLVRRTTHSLNLTPAGQTCLSDARALLQGWEHLEERHSMSKSDVKGVLRVIAPVALGQTWLADAAIDFQQQNPGITLSWELDDSEIQFTERGCDVWFRVGTPVDDSLIVRPIGHIERLLVAAPKVAQQYETASPEGLSGAPFVALSVFDGNKVTVTSKNGRQASIEGCTALATNNIFASYRAAKNGLGIAVMPKWFVAADLADGSLVDMLPDWRAPELTLNAAYLPSKWQPARLKLFTEHVARSVEQIDGLKGA